jgi:hypothetical protein
MEIEEKVMKTVLMIVALLPLAAQAQVVNQSTVINTVPGTQVVDSSDVKLPDTCAYRGPISRGTSFSFIGGVNAKGAMKKLLKAVEEVDANVVLVTLLNLNTGIPMAGIGYHCSDLKEVRPSLKVFIVPAG